MADYKFTSESEKTILKLPSTYISENGKGWQEYLDYTSLGGLTLPYHTKTSSVNYIIPKIEKLKSERNLLDFEYTFKGETNIYYADRTSFNDVLTKCISLSDSDPLPIPGSAWKTTEFESNMLNLKFVVFNVGEFKTFVDSFFNRSAMNFGIKEMHILNIRILCRDASKITKDILDYDYTVGWY